MSIFTLIAVGILLLFPILGLWFELRVEALQELLEMASFYRSIQVTLISGLGGALVSLLIGIPFARQFAIFDWKGKRWQRLMLLMPYLIPNFVLAIAYVLVWNPATGLMNSWLPFPGGLYGLAGMIFLFGIAHSPVVFLFLEEKFRRLDPSWREAARLSGAGSLRTFTKIELPVLLPSILSSFSLCFALNLSAFAIPAWIGAPAKAYPLTYKIYQSVQMGSEGLATAAVLSAILFLFTIPSLVLNSWIQRKEKKYTLVSGKASRINSTAPSTRSQIFFQIGFWLIQSIGWILPVAFLFVSTLVKPGCLQMGGWSCLPDASLSAYHYVIFDLAETQAALQGSLLYGSLSALIILFLAVFLMAMFGRNPWILRWADTLYSLPVATPGAVIALGLIVCASGKYGINLYNTAWIAVAAYVIKHFHMAFQSLKTGFSNISVSLVEAAKLCGAGPTQTWRRVMIPMLQPEILGGFFLVMVPILGELTMSVFLASPSFRTIGMVMFELQDYADQNSAAAMSILLILLVLAGNGMARILSKGKLGY